MQSERTSAALGIADGEGDFLDFSKVGCDGEAESEMLLVAAGAFRTVKAVEDPFFLRTAQSGTVIFYTEKYCVFAVCGFQDDLSGVRSGSCCVRCLRRGESGDGFI